MIGFHFLFLSSSIHLSSTFGLKNIELSRFIHWSPVVSEHKIPFAVLISSSINWRQKEKQSPREFSTEATEVQGHSRGVRERRKVKPSQEELGYQLDSLNISWKLYLIWTVHDSLCSPPFHHSTAIFIPGWEPFFSPNRQIHFHVPKQVQKSIWKLWEKKEFHISKK